MKNLLSKIILTTSVLIFLDQFSKYIIRKFGGFYICNANLAFGIKFSEIIYALIVSIIIIFLWSYFRNPKIESLNSKQFKNTNNKNSKHWFEKFEFGNFNLFRIWNLEFGILLILSGGISNIIDRLYFGCVIDFIDLNRFINWPIFNLADIYITFGVILILFNHLKSKK
jgi:lipoprotein signal peptidase